MNMEKLKAICRVVMPTLLASGLMAGLVTLVGAITFNAIPAAFGKPGVEAFPTWPWVIGSILLLMAVVAGLFTLLLLTPIGNHDDPRARSDARFTRYLVGIGYFLFVDAVVNMVAFAGIAHSGQLDRVFPVGDGSFKGGPPGQAETTWIGQIIRLLKLLQHSDEPVVLTIILMLSLGMALLGALFFFANALWEKFKKQEVFFDRNVFWGGLWFRLAEAIVFTIAVFLFLQFKGYRETIKYLPMIGLFIGMTIKSSETLVFGLAERLLASITSLVQGPPTPPPTTPPPTTPPPTTPPTTTPPTTTPTTPPPTTTPPSK